MIYAMSMATFLEYSAGAMFDFHLTEVLDSRVDQETLCKSLGYDGLAILSSPEAFAYAIKLTYYNR